jgi:hypothetical protein
MATDVDRQIARSAELLRRVSDDGRSLTRRARQYRRSGFATKAKRIGIAGLAILTGAVLWGGFFMPLGTSGVMIVLGLLALALLTFSMIPAVPEVRREKLAEADLKTLPLQTEIWLESQRKALPAPAVKLIDSIGVRLETLAPQLSRLNPQEPAAVEVRKLLSDHLPELVAGYQSIPEPLRREERNGRVPEQQLIDGLSVIDGEIDRMTEQLASGDLDKLATQNRFLELKYQEARALGEPGQ